MEFFELLKEIAFWQWLIAVIVWLVVTLGVVFLFLRWLLGRQWQFYQNLKRPVIAIRPISSNGDIMPGGSMKEELALLERNGFLNLSTEHTTASFDPSGKHCVVVLGYKDGMANIKEVVDRVKTHHVPLIVYTFGAKVSGGDQETFDSYPYTTYSNYPLNLLNNIFATVASYPYDER